MSQASKKRLSRADRRKSLRYLAGYLLKLKAREFDIEWWYTHQDTRSLNRPDPGDNISRDILEECGMAACVGGHAVYACPEVGLERLGQDEITRTGSDAGEVGTESFAKAFGISEKYAALICYPASYSRAGKRRVTRKMASDRIKEVLAEYDK